MKRVFAIMALLPFSLSGCSTSVKHHLLDILYRTSLQMPQTFRLIQLHQVMRMLRRADINHFQMYT